MSSHVAAARRLSVFFFLGFVLPVAALVRAPDIELKLDDYSLNTSSFCFPSGLRVMFQEDHTEPIVSMTMVVDRGSAADPVGEEGVAHLVEHLWFRSQHGTAPKIWDILHEMGASLNATTGSDVTTYMTVAPASMLPPLMRIEALRLTDTLSNVTEHEVNLEREIVRNELRMRYENSSGSFLQYIREKLFPKDHPYARLGIGNHQTISGLKLEQAQRFVAAHYVPANATVAVIGDLQIKDASTLLTSSFPKTLLADPKDPDADLKLVECPQRVKGPGAEPPPPVSQELEIHKAGVTKPLLVLAWSMPGGFRDDQMTLSFAAASLNAPVLEATRWHRGTSRHQGAEEGSFGGCGLSPEVHASTAICTISVGTRTDVEGLVHRIANNLNKIWDVDSRSSFAYTFSKARWRNMLGLFQSTERLADLMGGRGAITAQYTHFTGDTNYFSTNFQRLNKLEPTEPMLVAEKYLNRDRMVAVLLQPFEQGDIDLNNSEATYVGRPREPAANSAVDLSRITDKYVRALVKAPDLSQVQSFQLDNGLEVILLPHGEAPVAQATLMFRGGELTEPYPGFLSYARSFLKMPPQIGVDPFRIAGSWSSFASSAHQFFEISASSANLDAEIYLLRTALNDMEISARTGGDDYTDFLKKQLIRVRNQPESWASQVQMESLLPGHPISSDLGVDEVQAIRVTRPAKIRQYFHDVLQPANATLLVTGRFDPAQAADYISTYLGDWKVKGASGQPQPSPPGPTEPPAAQKILVFNKDSATQTALRLGCQLTPNTLASSEAKEVLRATLDEMAWVALREESAVTYGAGASVSNYPGGTSLLYLSSQIQNSAVEIAVPVMTSLTVRARAGELDPEIVTLMKAQQARRYVLGQQTTDQVSRRLLGPIMNDFGWESIMGHGARLASVSLEDLKAQMTPCAGREVVTLVGPAEVITPQLDKLGVSYEVFPWREEADKLWQAFSPTDFKRELKRRESVAAGVTPEGHDAGDDAGDEAGEDSFADPQLQLF